MPVVAVGLPRWREQIPNNRRNICDLALNSKRVQLIQVRTGMSIGGILRELQMPYGDILVAIGGGPGTRHLADLYDSSNKPVIPLDIQLREGSPMVGEEMYQKAMADPCKFFEYEPRQGAAAALAALTLKDCLPPVTEFEHRFFDLVSHLPRPRAFLVHLQNQDKRDYRNVQRFIDQVVKPIMEDTGYRSYEVGLNEMDKAFLNVEIFEKLRSSSLVVADLTGLRPNCFMEMGYAFGRNIRTIVTAKKGTKLPFDTSAIPCYFWSGKISMQNLRHSFKDFISRNINRAPLSLHTLLMD